MNKILIALAISFAVAVCIFGLGANHIYAQDEQIFYGDAGLPPEEPPQGPPPARPDTSKSDASGEMSKKLGEIAKTQKDILDGIAAIKEELKVIKIRITQSQ